MRNRRETKMEILEVGEFEISSGKMVVSDPCYDREVECAQYEIPANNGVWVASVKMMQDRVSSLIAKHIEQPSMQLPKTEDWDLGVDSGQLGFFDDSSYPTDQQRERDKDKSIDDQSHFYGRCCNATLNHKINSGIIDGSGVVSSSGYGDGSYIAHTQKDSNGNLVAIEVVFIEEDEEDEEY